MDERSPYNVGVVRIEPDERDVAHELITSEDDRGFRDLMGANDDDPLHPIGADAAYQVWLTPEEAETLRSGEASEGNNVRYVEPDIEMEPHYSWDPGAQNIPTPETKAHMRWPQSDLGAWHGTDVIVAVLDQGTTKAVRDYMGLTLLGRLVTGEALPAGQELFTNADDATGYWKHGCLVTPNCVPPGGKFFDVIVINSNGLSTAANFLAGVKYACDNGARLINYSFGSPPSSGQTLAQSQIDAFNYAQNVGAQIFISMGNDSTAGMGSPAFASKTYANVVSVTNFDERTDARWAGSNYDAAATGCTPGANVTSLLPDGTRTTWTGTSASSPHTCQMAVRLCTGGVYTAAQAVAALKATLRDTGQAAAQQGGGAFDFTAAAAYLTGQSPTFTGVATPTVVDSTGVVSNGGIGSLTVGGPAGIQADDVRIAVLTASLNAAPVAPEGWRLLRSTSDTTHRMLVWARAYVPGDPLRTTFMASTNATNWIMGVTMLTLRAPGGIDIDRLVPMFRFGNDAAPTGVQVIPRASNGLLVQLFAQRDTDGFNGTLSVPAGLTQQSLSKIGVSTTLTTYKHLCATAPITSANRIAGSTSASNIAGSWIAMSLAVAASPAPATPPVTTRRNLASVSSPILNITSTVNASAIKFVRSGCASSVAAGGGARSVSIAGPTGGPVNPGYWYTNFTGDGTASTTSSELDVWLPPFTAGSVVAGASYMLSLWSFYGTTVQGQALIYVNWLNAAGTSISTSTGTKQNIGNNTSSWTRISQAVTAPANAVSATVQMWHYSLTATASTALRWSGVLYEAGTTLGTFFDGDYAQGFWEGNNQNSPSTLFLDGSGRTSDMGYALAG